MFNTIEFFFLFLLKIKVVYFFKKIRLKMLLSRKKMGPTATNSQANGISFKTININKCLSWNSNINLVYTHSGASLYKKDELADKFRKLRQLNFLCLFFYMYVQLFDFFFFFLDMFKVKINVLVENGAVTFSFFTLLRLTDTYLVIWNYLNYI